MPQDAGFIFAPAQKLTTDSLAALSGGYIEVYEAGTSTPKTVYSDKALTTSLGSTVYLDSTGAPVASSGSSTRVTVYTGAAAVKLIIKTSAGVTLQTIDNLQCAQDTSLFGTGTGAASMEVDAVTTDTTLTASHNGHLLQCDPTGGTIALTLTTAITLGDGWMVSVRHDGTANQVKIASVLGQYIKLPGGSTTTGFALTAKGQTCTIVCDGAGFTVKDYIPPNISSTLAALQITQRLTAPPATPNPGARYIITGTPTGAWSSYAEHDVVEADGQGTWTRYTPPADAGWIAYVNAENLHYAFVGSAWVAWSNILAPAASALKTAKFEDQKANGTGGGTSVANTWTARTLNTEVENNITGCSLASNQITLPAGTFFIEAESAFVNVNHATLRFRSTTTSTQILGQTSIVATSGGMALLRGKITLSAPEVFSLDYMTDIANASGLGSASGYNSGVEIYSTVQITQLDVVQGPQGPTGPQGSTGADGADAGWKYTWSSNTSASDPSSGGIKGNNATLASITALYISETDADANGIAAEIAAWDDSTSAARSTIKVGNASGMILFRITGANTDNGTWVTLTGSVVASRGSLTGTVRVAPALTGDKGDTGATGATGNTGNTGATGATGPNTGLDYAWDTGTTDANPGSGNIRVNNATLGSATFAYISKTDRPGNSQGTNIDQWDASTNAHLGTLRVFDVATRTKGFTAEVTTAFTDGTTYWKIPLNSISVLSGGAPAASDVLAVVWSRTGNKGADGAGSGDVVGPASSTTGNLPSFNGTTGKLLQDSGIAAANVVTLAGSQTLTNKTLTSPIMTTPTLGTPASGTLTNATGLPISTGVSGLGTGVATFLATPSSANLIAAVTDETGTGALVFATSPTLVTPNLGTPSALTLTNATGLPAAGLVASTTQAVGFGSIELGHASDTTIARSAAGEVTIEGTLIQKAGRQTIFIPASAIIARTTNGAAPGSVEMSTNRNMFSTLDFDTTTQEFAQFEIHMPKSWNLGTITFQPVWSHASTTTNFGVVWALSAVARSDDDAGDVAFGTAQTSTDTGGTTNDIYIGPESAAITVAGTPAVGDTVQFQIQRNPADASDTMAIDARLHGIRVFYTTNASTDA